MPLKPLFTANNRAFRALIACLLSWIATTTVTTAANDAKREFAIAAGEASETLRQFAEQAGREIIFHTPSVGAVKTNPIRGSFTVRQGIDRLLTGTGLRASEDPQTGGIIVQRADAPQLPGTARTATGDRPAKTPDSARRTRFATSTATPPVRSAEAATVAGRVSNEATGAYLEGARVEVEGNGVYTLTDREGSFTLTMPPGNTTLVVSYLGLETTRRSFRLAAGETNVQTISLFSSFYKMAEVVVEGDREGSALAITRQREAPNAKNVVAADAQGSITDDNVGTFLQRLPGLTADFSGGITRTVMVRGISPELNTVAMDGVQLAGSDSSGTNRQFDFLQASMSAVESIEVTKAPTPDMPASSIGGNINLVTRTIFSRRNPKLFTYGIGLVHAIDRVGGRPESNERWAKEPIRKLTPSVRFSYSDVFGEKRNLGISLNYSRHVQYAGFTSANYNYQAVLDPTAYIFSFNGQVAAAAGPSVRQSTSAKIEYKPKEHTLISFTALYNQFVEDVDTRTHTFTTGNTAARFVPGYSIHYSEALPNAATTSQITSTALDNASHNYRFQSAVEHRLNDLIIDYTASLSLSKATQDFSPDTAAITISGLNNIGWIVDRREQVPWPKVTQTAGADAFNLGSYSSLVLTQNNRVANASIFEARVNALKKFRLAVPASLKTGFHYQQQRRNKDYDYYRSTFAGPGGLGQFADQDDWVKDPIRGRRPSPWADIRLITRHRQDNPGQWTEDISYQYVQHLQNLHDFRESIASFYLMGNVQLQDLGVLAGVRVEDTRTLGNGPLNRLTAEEIARRAQWTGPLTEEEIRRRAYAEWGERVRSEGQYRNVFPGIHFKYAHRSGLIGRASYTTSIGRPPITQLVPNTIVNEAGRSVTIANTGLKPQRAENFDVSLEYYFEPVGLFSAGVFLKEVKDFIFVDSSQIVGSGPDNGFDGLYEGFTISTRSNGGFARYRGFELNYQQQFTFLPGILRGLGVNANYTQLETKGDYGGTVATTEVAGFKPKTGNIAISYRWNRLDLRFQANWQDSHLVTVSTNPASIQYQAPRTFTSVKILYRVNAKTHVYLNVDNILDEYSAEQYRVSRDRVVALRTLYPTVAVGIQGRF